MSGKYHNLVTRHWQDIEMFGRVFASNVWTFSTCRTFGHVAIDTCRQSWDLILVCIRSWRKIIHSVTSSWVKFFQSKMADGIIFHTSHRFIVPNKKGAKKTFVFICKFNLEPTLQVNYFEICKTCDIFYCAIFLFGVSPHIRPCSAYTNTLGT